MHTNQVIGPNFINNETGKESITVQWWTLTPGQKLNNFHKVGFRSKMEAFLTLHGPFVLGRMENSQIYGTEGMVQQVVLQDHVT